MKHPHPIVILGGGNMGGALARRWKAAKAAPIHVVEPDAARRASLIAAGITCHERFVKPSDAATLVLAIKPQAFAELRQFLVKEGSFGNSLILSIMAGVPLSALQQISPQAVRIMPNLPAMMGEGMSVACAPNLAPASRNLVAQLFEAVGKFAWVEDEALIHATTAISGSGPGYVFAFMEALETAAIAQGIDAELARLLVRQTLRGAALLAENSPETSATLRAHVASPGGTTEAALATLTNANFSNLIAEAVKAATQRSRQLGDA